jgi:molybdate transport system substrate-binding protein
MEFLTQKKIIKEVESKLIYGMSVSQVNQYVMTDAVDAGFTAKSSLMSEKLKGVGHWIEIDESLYQPIKQGMLVLKQEDNTKASEEFQTFVLSEKGKQILKKYGF